METIKQLGRGSFSNVYLCKLTSNELFDDTPDGPFVVKEINIKSLVANYIQNNRSNRIKQNRMYAKKIGKSVEPSVSPYERTTMCVDKMSSEEDYYYKKLQELVRSEVEVMTVLPHQNIVKFLGYSNHVDGLYNLYMEYCEGGDVSNLLKKGADRNLYGGLADNIVLDFVQQVSSGLKHIHDANVIHRDIKLQNVLVCGNQFKITDFGFACLDMTSNISNLRLDWDDDAVDILKRKYLKLCGTPFYMAPELILNTHLLENFKQYKFKEAITKEEVLFYNKSVDLWSLGICVFEMIFNGLPFPKLKSMTEMEQFYKKPEKEFQAYIDNLYVRKSISKDLKGILRALLQVNPLNRTLEYTLAQCEYQLENVSLEDNSTVDDVESFESWEKLEQSTSLLKMSVEKGFLDWLINKIN